MAMLNNQRVYILVKVAAVSIEIFFHRSAQELASLLADVVYLLSSQDAGTGTPGTPGTPGAWLK
jgi:hypothetical protein